MWFGIVAGTAGLEHGFFETLQGNTKPASVMFASWGPPCVPEEIWYACEPAMSLLPNFLISGILTILLGLVIIFWAAGFLQRKNGGLVLLVLSILLLLVGGGFFPPVIGMVGGAAGMKINRPILREQLNSPARAAAKFWPWPLVIFLVWILGQFPVGYFFNDFLKSIMGFGLLLILTMLPLSVYAAYTHDAAGQGV
jgi:hypothetical protein